MDKQDGIVARMADPQLELVLLDSVFEVVKVLEP